MTQRLHAFTYTMPTLDAALALTATYATTGRVAWVTSTRDATGYVHAVTVR